MSILGVIPARYGSTRFPGKPLIPIAGVPMITRVLRQALKATLLDQVIVATDHEEIAREVQKTGDYVMMTSSNHASGSDRLLEVAKNIEADIYVNIQGDEPFLDPEMIDEAITYLQNHREWDVTTTAVLFLSKEEWENPNRVKVLCNDAMQALYFTRIPIPRTQSHGIPPNVYRHLGLYVYRQETLRAFGQLPIHPVEKEESLEQLRLLMAGYHFGVLLTEHDSPSVDVYEDVKQIEQWMIENKCKDIEGL
ncbi:MAG: 3-deoxy-manno-octulosonate cytidylyltransferase [Candidatus Marinimicrobia bacterium]|nr:3-deoxy-manno-octulosonate cytidylyltransferase [Candidatus Neomarinimicrobiota bacterium]MDD5582618.1 3-deoxy-manno-octulosonate cytidylyltransferase [Candidatus Neomarinimicrobiota bacterium]